MKRTYDKIDLTIFTLIGALLGCIVMGLLSTHIYEPRIAELQVMLIEQQDTCPENKVCYEPYGTGVEPQYILQGAIVKVNFVTPERMIEITGNDTTDGFAEWRVNEQGTLSLCKITTVMPERVLGDPAMDTLGHELLHCLAGSYHE